MLAQQLPVSQMGMFTIQEVSPLVGFISDRNCNSWVAAASSSVSFFVPDNWAAGRIWVSISVAGW